MAVWYTVNPYHCRPVSSYTKLTVITKVVEVAHSRVNEVTVRSKQSHFLSFMYFGTTAFPVTAENNTREAEHVMGSIQLSFSHWRALWPFPTTIHP